MTTLVCLFCLSVVFLQINELVFVPFDHCASYNFWAFLWSVFWIPILYCSQMLTILIIGNRFYVYYKFCIAKVTETVQIESGTFLRRTGHFLLMFLWLHVVQKNARCRLMSCIWCRLFLQHIYIYVCVYIYIYRLIDFIDLTLNDLSCAFVALSLLVERSHRPRLSFHPILLVLSPPPFSSSCRLIWYLLSAVFFYIFFPRVLLSSFFLWPCGDHCSACLLTLLACDASAITAISFTQILWYSVHFFASSSW